MNTLETRWLPHYLALWVPTLGAARRNEVIRWTDIAILRMLGHSIAHCVPANAQQLPPLKLPTGERP